MEAGSYKEVLLRSVGRELSEAKRREVVSVRYEKSKK